MTVKELIEKLKEFPEDMEVLNYEYFDILDVEKEVPPNCDTECVIVS
jgi:hypothetical protein